MTCLAVNLELLNARHYVRYRDTVSLAQSFEVSRERAVKLITRKRYRGGRGSIRRRVFDIYGLTMPSLWIVGLGFSELREPRLDCKMAPIVDKDKFRKSR